MATIVAASGGGNWTATTTWTGGVVPTASDDVQLSSTSGAVTINASVACRSLTCTGYTNTLTHSAGFTLSIGDATAGLSNVALKFVSGMTYTAANATTCIIAFVSTSTTVQTIDGGSKTLPATTFTGVGSSYQLAGGVTLNSSSTLTHSNGTIDTNGQTISVGSYQSNSGLARVLTLGASTFAVNGNGTGGFNIGSATNMTLNAGTSTILLQSGNLGFVGGGFTFYNITVKSGAAGGTSLTGIGGTLNNMTIDVNQGQRTYAILGQNLTVTTFVMTDSLAGTQHNPPFIGSTVRGTQRTITATNVTISNGHFQDIIGAGAGTWSGTNIGNMGNNSGITFTTPVTRYWVGNGGSTLDTAHWSATSGGTSGASIPLPQDTAIFDANSITTTGQTITVAGSYNCGNVSFSGLLNNPAISIVATNANSLWPGSLNLTGTFTFSQSNTISLEGTGTLTSNGKTFGTNLQVNATGTYTLGDAFVCSGVFQPITGTFNTGNFNMTVSRFISSGSTTKSMTLGTSTITCTSAANNAIIDINSGGFSSVSMASSTFVISAAATVTRTFNGGGFTYGTLTYTVAGSTGALLIAQNNTFTTINFSDTTSARSLLIGSSSTQIVTNFNVNGTSGVLMTIASSTNGLKYTLSKATGIVSIDYVTIQDSLATGNASAWYAGSHSTNVSNNTGWAFYAPPTGFGNLNAAIA